MIKKLSILTCTLYNRNDKFKILNNHLKTQVKYRPEVEMIANIDSGQKSIGQKRNELLCAAKGEYIVFVDDDDWVSDDYVARILTAISQHSPDCCGIVGTINIRNAIKTKFVHSIKYDQWYNESGIYYRCPNHLNPVKKQLALTVGFQNLSKGEDYDYSLRLKPFLKTEVFIKKPIYYYKPSR